MICKRRDQPDFFRLSGRDQGRRIEQSLRLRRANQIDQQLGVMQRIDKTQLGRRNTKACGWPGDAEIARHRKAATAADTIAVNNCDGWLGCAGQCVLQLVDRSLIGGAPCRVLRACAEFGNVRACTKGAVPLARMHDHHADGVISHRVSEQQGEEIPHLLIKSITLVGPVNDQMRNFPVFVQVQGHAGSTTARCFAIWCRVVIQTSECLRTCWKNSSSAQIRPGLPIIRKCSPRLIILGLPSSPSR